MTLLNYDHIRQQAQGRVPSFVQSDTAAPLARYEAFRGHHDRRHKTLTVAGGVLRGGNIDISWLPAAAETYRISADPDDYVLVDVPIVTVDIPNRNMQAFPLEEVAFFDPMKGRQTYKTFVGKATHANHANSDPLQAKGVHFDAAMEFIPAYGLYKIRVLTGWDRTKDRKLVDDIESGKRPGFSMGALVSAFVPLVAGTRVATAQGLVPIETIVEGTIVETKNGPKRSAGAVATGFQKVVTIRTRAGTNITAARQHPFYVIKPNMTTRWVEAGDLRVGDFVGVRVKPTELWPKELAFQYDPIDSEYDADDMLTCAICGLKFPQLHKHITSIHHVDLSIYRARYSKRVLNGSLTSRDITYPKTMTPELAALLGYYMSEGAYGHSGAFVGFCGNKDKPELWEHYFSAFRTTFGCDPSNASVRAGIRDFYEYLGVSNGYARDKEVPWSILQAPKECVAAFLRAYWEGDGSAAGSDFVTFYTASPQLAQDVAVLLQRFGIPTTTGTNTQEAGSPLPNGRVTPQDCLLYRVHVFGKSADRFITEIGATSNARKKDLEDLRGGRNVTQYGEEIPYGLEKLHELYDQHKHGDRTVGTPYYTTSDGTVAKLSLHRVDLKDNSVLAYGHFDRWDDLLPNIRKLNPEVADRFQKLIDERVMWVPVTETIEHDIERQVYCLRDVQDEHNFVAEGYIVHNCSVCGAIDTNTDPCRHMDSRAGMQKGALWDVAAGRRLHAHEARASNQRARLVYQQCCGAEFFETSSVEDPADPSADVSTASNPIWIP